MVPSPITPDTESELSDLSEDLDLLQQLEHLLEEERGALIQYHTSSENLIDLGAEDMQRDQQQWHLLKTLPEATATTRDLHQGPWTSPTLMHTSQRAPAAEEGIQQSDDLLSTNPPPSPAVAAAICLMVEDPYFDTPMNSPSAEEAAVGSSEDAKPWTVSPIFSTPSLCLNDQTLELNSPASGKWSYLCMC